jgi:small subunit ribosomal protein S9
MELINALGRRKAAIARIYVKEGKGEITINKRGLLNYFPEARLQYIVNQPLIVTEKLGTFDINVNLCGGGIKGQAEALRLAIARALVKFDEENKSVLRKNGFLTRDAREVERKKPGQKKARKKFQFSKR